MWGFLSCDFFRRERTCPLQHLSLRPSFLGWAQWTLILYITSAFRYTLQPQWARDSFAVLLKYVEVGSMSVKGRSLILIKFDRICIAGQPLHCLWWIHVNSLPALPSLTILDQRSLWLRPSTSIHIYIIYSWSFTRCSKFHTATPRINPENLPPWTIIDSICRGFAPCLPCSRRESLDSVESLDIVGRGATRGSSAPQLGRQILRCESFTVL